MAINFPNSPTTNQIFSPGGGAPSYRWDGEKWTTTGISATKTPVYTDGSTPMSAQLTLLASDPVSGNDAARKSYVDARMALAGNQITTGGFAFTAYNVGNVPANFTPNPMNGNYQFCVNNGAATFNAPTIDCAIDLLMTNSATAGAMTMTGYTYAAGNVGDPWTTVNGARFIISIRRINGISTFTVKALQ